MYLVLSAPDYPTGWIVIVIFLLIVIAIMYYLIPRLNKKRFAAQPEMNVPAKVAEKCLRGHETIHNVTFELDGGKKLTFDLSEEQYNALAEGASGILTYKKAENVLHKEVDLFLGFALGQNPEA
ncbi:MAG: DUF2500 domain-containing protein [Clostridiales bacterium]|nr:DUF2500 domain-containing protein [Clostridiales bacterium]